MKSNPLSETFAYCLTGGIATGKSRVGDWLSHRGWSVICTDEIVHEFYRPGQPLVAALVEEFGPEVKDHEGGIDRKVLGEKVFRHIHARERLHEIVHPRVREEWKRRVQSCGEEKKQVVVIIPLAYETGVDKDFREVWVVACSEACQIARLEGRGLDQASARLRIDSQWSLQKKIDLADRVIWNQCCWELTKEQLQLLVDTLHSSE